MIAMSRYCVGMLRCYGYVPLLDRGTRWATHAAYPNDALLYLVGFGDVTTTSPESTRCTFCQGKDMGLFILSVEKFISAYYDGSFFPLPTWWNVRLVLSRRSESGPQLNRSGGLCS
jgi:hypothetical protein